MTSLQALNPYFKLIRESIKLNHPIVVDNDALESAIEQILLEYDKLNELQGNWEERWKEQNLSLQEGLDVHVYFQETLAPMGYAFPATKSDSDEMNSDQTIPATIKIKVAKMGGVSVGNSGSYEKMLEDWLKRKIVEKIWFVDGMHKIHIFIQKLKREKDSSIPHVIPEPIITIKPISLLKRLLK